MQTKEKTNPRQRIVDTAIRLFFEQGYRATGINQIIAEADVCKASFYANFPSKEDLCLDYIKTSHENWMMLLNREIAKHKRPYDRIMAVFAFLERWMEQCSYRGCGLMNISSEMPEVKGKIRSLIQDRNHILKDGIAGLVSDLKEEDPRFKHIVVHEVASFLLILIQGAISASQAHIEAVPIRQAKNNFRRFLDSYART